MLNSPHLDTEHRYHYMSDGINISSTNSSIVIDRGNKFTFISSSKYKQRPEKLRGRNLLEVTTSHNSSVRSATFNVNKIKVTKKLKQSTSFVIRK